MLYYVTKRDPQLGRDVGIDADGTICNQNRDRWELMPPDVAQVVADLHGGVAVSEARAWPQDFETDITTSPAGLA